MIADRFTRLVLPLGIVLIGLGSLLRLFDGDADAIKFVSGALLGLGIAAEVYAMYALNRGRPA